MEICEYQLDFLLDCFIKTKNVVEGKLKKVKEKGKIKCKIIDGSVVKAKARILHSSEERNTMVSTVNSVRCKIKLHANLQLYKQYRFQFSKINTN